MDSEKKTSPKKRKTRIAISVIAALFGVQSERNRQQDFNQQSPRPFIIGGIIAIGLFVALLITITLLVTAKH
ncbi:DUF2970 domain-containing protein [Photobacterium profundum]|uniref:DUF2970 domain-containing protein n=1 Tax=Photobacterium profundum 3TCK TaxID=314280 RepID=Q1Z019_9GAMM|nr:DUF2970 domain-containing protein [Photobacterium profundum]EAS41852.1 hypothetical protein P3TCK_00175 [Photobacterium profundum 3TCK]PSV61217.1 DUF2970 domain-containing protein [Photobacterium profundum]